MADDQQQRSYRIPGLAWLVFLIGVTIYEGWALHTHNFTLSEWVWKQNSAYPWFKWVVLGGTTFLMWHFFWPRK